jgi:hypothetical protein
MSDSVKRLARNKKCFFTIAPGLEFVAIKK